MASRLENIGNLFSDVKTRTIILFAGGVLVFAIFVGLYSLLRGSGQGPESGARVADVPQVSSTPGVSKITPEQTKLLEELNEQRYQDALRRGGAALPSVFGEDDSDRFGNASGANRRGGGGVTTADDEAARNRDRMLQGLGISDDTDAAAQQGQAGGGSQAGGTGMAGQGGLAGEGVDPSQLTSEQLAALAAGQAGQGGLAGQAGQGAGLAGQGGAAGQAGQGAQGGQAGDGQSAQALTAEQLAQLQQDLSDKQDQLQQQLEDLAQRRTEEARRQLQQNMERQAKSIMASWAGPQGTPAQDFQQGTLATAKQQQVEAEATADATASQASSSEAAPAKEIEPDLPVAIKTGDVMFGVLNTSVNTDEDSPVLATLVSGEFKNGRLIGKIQKQSVPGTNGPNSVIISFNRLSLPDEEKSISVNAVAIDPDTARTALASNIDHHYMYRYGTLFASSFLSGYANAITQAGSVTINNTDGSSTQFRQQLSPTDELLAGLGEVGSAWADQLGDAFNRPNTITVDSGTGIGVLFLSDVSLP